jgi:hypothetical protein
MSIILVSWAVWLAWVGPRWVAANDGWQAEHGGKS